MYTSLPTLEFSYTGIVDTYILESLAADSNTSAETYSLSLADRMLDALKTHRSTGYPRRVHGPQIGFWPSHRDLRSRHGSHATETVCGDGYSPAVSIARPSSAVLGCSGFREGI
jgi:hypothetical protein